MFPSLPHRKDRQALQRLTEAAEKAKIELSAASSTQISLPFITATADGPKHIDRSMTRADFERVCSDLIDRCRVPVEKALSDAGLKMADINEVILVGGSTRIPAVQDLVQKMTGKKPNMSVNPDEVVALGAAVQVPCCQQRAGECMQGVSLASPPHHPATPRPRRLAFCPARCPTSCCWT